jgi:tRNA1Val (adenine37-N6)-methyltransferase
VTAVSEDRFLGGRIVAHQPEHGFRSGLDAVLLASAVPAAGIDAVLELGSGAGVASLCLGARVLTCSIAGLEIAASLVALANANAQVNEIADRVRFEQGDALEPPAQLRRDFAHVFCNPPFHGDEGKSSPQETRTLALQDFGTLGAWLAAGMKRVRSRGTLTIILRADRLGEALGALPERGVTVFPLWPRVDEPAKRVIVQVRKDLRTPLVLLPGLVLHECDGQFTAAADVILRGMGSLALAKPPH